jgi:mono/diheme cytochrome c family protein
MKDKTIVLILIIILAIAIAVIIGATSYPGQRGYYSQQGYGSMMGGNMMGFGVMGGSMMGSGMMGNGYNKDSFSSNGERIYYTGIESTGSRIGLEGGPMWLNMRGGSCVNCHGSNGKGGVPVMMGTAVPEDLTNLYAPHSHGDEKMIPYNDDLLERAITKGIDANGESLGPTMPRWYMPEKDLNDLVTYIKTLQTEDQK